MSKYTDQLREFRIAYNSHGFSKLAKTPGPLITYQSGSNGDRWFVSAGWVLDVAGVTFDVPWYDHGKKHFSVNEMRLGRDKSLKERRALALQKTKDFYAEWSNNTVEWVKNPFGGYMTKANYEESKAKANALLAEGPPAPLPTLEELLESHARETAREALSVTERESFWNGKVHGAIAKTYAVTVAEHDHYPVECIHIESDTGNVTFSVQGWLTVQKAIDEALRKSNKKKEVG